MASKTPITMLGTGPAFTGVGQLQIGDTLAGIVNHSDFSNNSVIVSSGSGVISPVVLASGTVLGNTGGGIGALSSANQLALLASNLGFTTKGELLVYDGTSLVKQDVAANGLFLKYDNSSATGIVGSPAGSAGGVTEFTQLSDVTPVAITPADALKFVQVNAAGTALEFNSFSSPGDTNIATTDLVMTAPRTLDIDASKLEIRSVASIGPGNFLALDITPAANGGTVSTTGRIDLLALYGGDGGGITVSHEGIELYFLGAGQFKLGGAVVGLGQTLVGNAAGQLEFGSPSGVADNLGNHIATQTLSMSTFGLTAVGSVIFSSAIEISSPAWRIFEDTTDFVLAYDGGAGFGDRVRYEPGATPGTSFMRLGDYPTTRDDQVTSPPLNFIYTGPAGEVYSAPTSLITDSISTVNLGDVNAAPPTVRAILQHNGTEYLPTQPSSIAGGIVLGNLFDVIQSGAPAVGAFLRHDGTNWVDATPVLALLDDVDTTTTAPVSGQLLMFEGNTPSSAKFEPTTVTLDMLQAAADVSLFDGSAAHSLIGVESISLQPGGENVTWSLGITVGGADTLLFSANGAPRFAMDSAGSFTATGYGAARPSDHNASPVTNILYAASSGAFVKANFAELDSYVDANSAILGGVVEGELWKADAQNRLGVPQGTLMTTVNTLAVHSPKTVQTKTASFTPVVTDAESIIVMNSVGPAVVTVPDDITTPFPTGSRLEFIQKGDDITFTGMPGVTIGTFTGNSSMTSPWSKVELMKIGSDEWVLSGDLTV